MQHIGGVSEVLHLKDLHCTKIVQNKRIFACRKRFSLLRDLRANGARSCCRKALGEPCGEKRDGRIPEKSPPRQSRNLPDTIGIDQSTRDARSWRASSTDARRGGRSRRPGSTPYKKNARPSRHVTKKYEIDRLLTNREDAIK